VIVINGKEGAALGIGGNTMGGRPFCLDGGVVKDARRGLAQVDAHPDVFLCRKRGELMRRGGGAGRTG